MFATFKDDGGSLDLAIERKARPRHIVQLCNVAHSKQNVTDFQVWPSLISSMTGIELGSERLWLLDCVSFS
ncbi:hypothetical protein [Rhizobium leguminosarum]|uniref:hypothetical protein n=1 Tax=Rhizobium leguminosarum TaxID=384 RepID=UPI001AE5C280|nr:hypothetical protein [Rhizobium leguminosarum]MBP2447247.1 hypothetical protein [Rhizobium leguminosarum]